MTISDATMAAYFRYGIEAGIFGEVDAKNWAYSVIEARDTPPVEIIELAMGHGRTSLFENLKNIHGTPDIKLAGRWLLGKLKQELRESPSEIRSITRKAMQVARSTMQPDDTYYRFDGIDDEIFLAINGKYGTLDLCRSDLESALDPFEPYENT